MIVECEKLDCPFNIGPSCIATQINLKMKNLQLVCSTYEEIFMKEEMKDDESL
jgi:hypothetical protein